MQPHSAPLAGYIRVSRVGGRDRSDGFISPTVQEEAIRAWSERTGIDVVVHEPELNVSGGTMNRPIFKDILAAVARGERGGIVVYRIDRFARSVVGALTTLAELGEHKAAFASTSENISYVTAQDRAFLQMQFVFAEYVRATLKESWRVATSDAVGRGIHISPHVPFGYDRAPATRRYVPNEFAPLVGEVFRLRGDRWGWHRLCSFLDEHAPQPDGQRWGVSRLQRMLSNRVYLGEARYGTETNPDAHDALVSRTEFERATEARGTMLARRPGKEPILLAGLVRCASCRYLLKEGSGKQASGPVRTYRCNSRAVHGRCPSPQSIVGTRLEDFVVDAFKSHLRRATGHAVPSSSDLDEARIAHAEAQAELQAFTSDLALAKRLRAGGAYESGLSVRLEAVEKAEKELSQLTEATLGDGLVELSAWDFDVEAWWAATEPDARKVALAGAIDCILLRGPGRGEVAPRVLILWRGQGPEDLPRRGRNNGAMRPYVWPDAQTLATTSLGDAS